MTDSRNGYKVITAILLLAMLLFAWGFTFLSTGEEILETLGAYRLLESWKLPAALLERMEDAIRYELPYRLEMRDIFSATLAARGKRDTGTFYIVKDSNGYLHYTDLYQEFDTDTAEYARRMANLKEKAAQAGAQTLFVGASGKFELGTTEMPGGYPLDYASLWNLNALFLNLLAYQVPNLDLREDFSAASLAYEDCYYRTDSHWTARASLYAAGRIAKKAQEAFGMEMDIDGFFGDFSHYELSVYPQSLLGDIGHSVGIPFSGLDDFMVLTPTFETDLTVTAHQAEDPRSGAFSESVLDVSYLQMADPRYSIPSNAYFGEDITHVRIENKLLPEGEHILLLCDRSYLTTAAYLALMCARVDVRIVPDNSVSSMERLVGGGDYTLVVVACDAQSVGADMFPFFTAGLPRQEDA